MLPFLYSSDPMKKRYIPLTLLVAAGIGSCTTASFEDDLWLREQQQQPTAQIKDEQELSLEEIAVPENRFHWTGDPHIKDSLLHYNPTIRTLEAGLESEDLIVVLFRDAKPIKADDARVNFYRDEKAATIEYKVDGEWLETRPGNPGNIDLNNGEESGVYKTVDDLMVWPEDPVDGWIQDVRYKYRNR